MKHTAKLARKRRAEQKARDSMPMGSPPSFLELASAPAPVLQWSQPASPLEDTTYLCDCPPGWGTWTRDQQKAWLNQAAAMMATSESKPI